MGVSLRRRRLLQFGALGLLGLPPARAAGGRVLIAGGGFAGARCALALKQLAPALDVVLVDPQEPYLGCPLSSSVLVGLRDFDVLQVSREGLGRAGVRYRKDRVVAVNAERHRVRLASGARLDYQRLVVAPGIRLLWGSPEGYDEVAAQWLPHAWIAGEQTQRLGAQLRQMDEGGVVAIAVPRAPYRCPPGPYERACLIADFLQRHKPRAKLLILDANNHFPRQDLFTDAWRRLYPGRIEWVPVTQGGAVQRVEAQRRRLHAEGGTHPVAVGNVIPAQAPGQLALDAGLCRGRGWCPVSPVSFESTIVADVHVIGDACIAGAMPKAASAASSQGLQCARAIAALLDGGEVPAPELDSLCYSQTAPDRAFAIVGAFEVGDGAIRARADAPKAAPDGTAQSVEDWYRQLLRGAFGA